MVTAPVNIIGLPRGQTEGVCSCAGLLPAVIVCNFGPGKCVCVLSKASLYK